MHYATVAHPLKINGFNPMHQYNFPQNLTVMEQHTRIHIICLIGRLPEGRKLGILSSRFFRLMSVESVHGTTPLQAINLGRVKHSYASLNMIKQTMIHAV